MNSDLLIYQPDIELETTEVDLNDIKTMLSVEEDKALREILELEKEAQGQKDLFREVLESAKKSALDYLEGMTGIAVENENLRNPQDVSKWDKTDIDISHPSADPNVSKESRKMSDARTTPFDKNVNQHTQGMSDCGKKTLERDLMAYEQRTKSITALSKDGNTIDYKTNKQANLESLAGLRSYKVGPVVPMYSVSEMEEKFRAQCPDKLDRTKTASFVRKTNFDRFDTELMSRYGFKSKAEAQKWRKDHNLTIHEGPDGMMLVPRDVHDGARHKGYCSEMTSYLHGDSTKAQLNKFISDEKIAYIKHEAKIRAKRAAKSTLVSVGKSVLVGLLKDVVGTIISEMYKEFSSESDDKFVERVKRAFKQSWQIIKDKVKQTLKSAWESFKSNVIAEIFTALNDFVFNTFKNTLRIIRKMWGSIKSAFKIIFKSDKSVSFGERLYEATKVLTAGVVALLGFGLNELIDKGLTSLGIPFSSYIAECFSGLFAGITSGLVLLLFDRFKTQFFSPSVSTRIIQQQSKLIHIQSAKISLSSLEVNMKMKATYEQIVVECGTMKIAHESFVQKQSEVNVVNKKVKRALAQQDDFIANLEKLKNDYVNDEDF